ncbi:MAG: CBS domain-containing protein [Bacteroidetes bacterium]|nr:MAG: CBS domain-containing protein [Bacteroidota bacterium]
MGDLNVRSVQSRHEQQQFMRYLLRDVQALERMLQENWFESDIVRIGAEQEMCLVDSRSLKPMHINLQALEIINSEAFTSELANFNLEANLDPRTFTGTALSDMHQQLKETLDSAQQKVHATGATILLAGILPTIRKSDVEIANITPLDRYRALMDGLAALRGEAFELRIAGIDELNLEQETAMLEACNTSFQVHLQVSPDDFVRKYNYAQALAGPTMAISVNSPMLFGRRLWHETRIALFQQSIDIRTFTDHLRDRSPRVTFGKDWLHSSIMEIYREDIARFQVLLTTDVDEDVMAMLEAGTTPRLRALNIHNSTVYRWNRPCYGISPNGKPHLRIENRILPSGPSVPDAMANAAFWLGLMNGMEDSYPDITQHMEFADAKANFFAAARFGMDTQLTWTHGIKISPSDLILGELLPMARTGLQKAGIAPSDIDKYLGIIEARTASGRTGSSWMLKSFNVLAKQKVHRDEIISAITASIYQHQHEGKPVHEWDLACTDKWEYEPSSMLVEEFMTTDIITVQEDDILDLPANLMDWRRIRHVAVEDHSGKLVGLITSRMMLRHYGHAINQPHRGTPTLVKDIMRRDPITVAPEDSIIKAMELMQSRRVGSLPVMKNGNLIGMITEAEFLDITSALIKRLARRGGRVAGARPEAVDSNSPAQEQPPAGEEEAPNA